MTVLAEAKALRQVVIMPKALSMPTYLQVLVYTMIEYDWIVFRYPDRGRTVKQYVSEVNDVVSVSRLQCPFPCLSHLNMLLSSRLYSIILLFMLCICTVLSAGIHISQLNCTNI
jgi:hypothetical protein